MITSMYDEIENGDIRALSRAISLVINGKGDKNISGSAKHTPVIGITGPPGAGKSTLADKLIGQYVRNNDKVAVLCVDPSSPFTQGAILGDRIRMSAWYNHANVFIRSLATRGSLGGLPHDAGQVIQLVKIAPFDAIIIETVGVGQNEIEVAALADITIVVLVPESGDDIQFMKAGLMEIGDMIVVNKCDRPGADHFANDIREILNEEGKHKPVMKTIANTNTGVQELYGAVQTILTQKGF